jgi:hypothetical protein
MTERPPWRQYTYKMHFPLWPDIHGKKFYVYINRANQPSGEKNRPSFLQVLWEANNQRAVRADNPTNPWSTSKHLHFHTSVSIHRRSYTCIQKLSVKNTWTLWLCWHFRKYHVQHILWQTVQNDVTVHCLFCCPLCFLYASPWHFGYVVYILLPLFTNIRRFAHFKVS